MPDTWIEVFKQKEHERNARECEAYARILTDRRALLGQLGITARAWRRAEVKASAISLGLQQGSVESANIEAKNRLVALRIATDEYNRS